MYFTFSCLVNLAIRLWNIAKVLLQKVDELVPPQAFEKKKKTNLSKVNLCRVQPINVTTSTRAKHG